MQRPLRLNPSLESSDIDGTTNRVASVTLESDSLSEEPKSFRNKRRKRLPKREKFMRIDNEGKEQRELSSTTSTDREEISVRKMEMEWENISAAAIEPVLSETDEISSGGSNVDADDEQSDWREFSDLQLNPHQNQTEHDRKGDQDSNLSKAIIQRIERFVLDTEERELILTHAYHSTQIKELLSNSPSIKIFKRGRRIILKKA